MCSSDLQALSPDSNPVIFLILMIFRLGLDLDKDSMKTVYEKFGLEPGTQDFIGHAMALHLDDEYVCATMQAIN